MAKITKQEALNHIGLAYLARARGENAMFPGEFFEFLKSTNETEIIVELVRFDSKYASHNVVAKALDPFKYEKEDMIKRYNLIGKLILVNPEITENALFPITKNDLIFLKENYEKCMGTAIDKNSLSIIEKGIADRELISKKKSVRNNGGQVKETSGVSAYPSDDKGKRPSGPLYANRNGSLSNSPASSRSRRIL